ncbi:nickel/cobalt transporter [Orbus mooreae]|uniref:nickel/cobalt transporter n=1 Tax=Orbus mooreae TaxID=3074107 RepID=UPI00370D6CAA
MQIKKIITLSFWLLIITTIIIVSGIGLYHSWFELVNIAQDWQRYFHKQLIQFLIKAKDDPFQVGTLLLYFSFLYGILHSAGPGHGKIIISTYLATQPKQLKKSLLLTLLSAIMQGVTAVILITATLIILNVSTKYLTIGEYRLEQMSYILIILIGIYLCYRTIKKLIKIVITDKNNQKKIGHIRPLNPQNSPSSLSSGCQCCNHKHLPNQHEMAHTKGWLGDLGIILSIGIRPCSGSLLVLIFSYSFGVYYWGILATFAISIGTAVTTSLFAIFVHYARKTAERLINKDRTQNRRWVMISQFIALIGGVLLVIMGLILIIGMSTSYYPIGNPILAR